VGDSRDSSSSDYGRDVAARDGERGRDGVRDRGEAETEAEAAREAEAETEAEAEAKKETWIPCPEPLAHTEPRLLNLRPGGRPSSRGEKIGRDGVRCRDGGDGGDRGRGRGRGRDRD
jgi:hypothetical protein